MIRYLKQPDLSGCGPIAIMNALKWANIKVTLRQYLNFRKLCLTDRDGSGTDEIKITIAKQKRIKSKFVKSVTLKQINTALDSGQSIILGYCSKSKTNSKKNGSSWEGHFIFIANKTAKTYTIVNHAPDKHFHSICKENRAKYIKTKAIVPQKVIKRYLDTHYNNSTLDKLDCWIISKK
jgi:hypothetical protein